jgi:hypothetical protein
MCRPHEVAIKPRTLDEFVMEVFRTPDGATYLGRPGHKDDNWPFHGALEPTEDADIFKVGPHPRE